MTFTAIGQSTPLTFEFEPKSIIEDFQTDYGRMNAILGVEIKHTNQTNQTSIIQSYNDPPTEIVGVSDRAVPVGTAGDGTQLWKITHNGVDSHGVHFHMFHVQVVNRVGWDGAIRPPDPNELGWKDTVRMNPLEDIVVAVRPIALTNLPASWVNGLPNSYRPLAPAFPIGSPLPFTNVDPNGNPVTITNQVMNFGWEYVWHCHLLSHEENDMMRALVVAVPPAAPSNLVATSRPTSALLTWTDNSLTASGFTVQRISDPAISPVSILTQWSLGKVTTFTDSTFRPTSPAWYRVMAANTVGSTVPGYPTLTANSPWSNNALAASLPATANVSPGALAFAPQLQGTTSAAQTAILSNVGSSALPITSVVLNGANPGDFTLSHNCPASLAAGKSCTLTVRFRPTTTGTRTSQVNINAGKAVVALTGNGILGLLSVSPASLAFSSPLNVTTAAQAVTVQNTGTAPLTISTVPLGGANSGQFARTHNCPAVLPVNGTCTVNVTFRPTAVSPNPKSATLTVNVAAPAVDVSVTLGGTVLLPVLTVSPAPPASLAFGSRSLGAGPTPAQQVIVTNTGTAPLSINSTLLGGANPGQFARNPTCVGPLAPTQSCTINVTFDPTTVGAKSAVLNVNVAAPATGQSVSLTGTGTP